MIIGILAGGSSRRMGRDKGEVEIDGEPLLLRTARLAEATGETIAVIGRTRPEWWPTSSRVTFLPDEKQGLGPAGGLATGLRQFDEPMVLLSCDLPLLDLETTVWLVEHLSVGGGRDGTVLLNGGNPEPLLSLYRPAVLSLLDVRLAEGRRSLSGLHEAGDFGRIEIPEELAGKIRGANTPEELRNLLGDR